MVTETPVDINASPTNDLGTDAQSDSTPEQQVQTLNATIVQQEAKIASILEIANALRATRSEDELLNLIMEKISLLMDADRSTLFLKDDDTDELWTKFTEGRRTIEVRLSIGEGIAGWVAKTGKSINIKDAYKDPRFNPDIDNRTGYRTGSILCQPMRNQDRRIIGVIQVLNKRHGYFTVEDELLLSAVASQAAIVIENSGLYHSVLETNYELNEIREALEVKIQEQDMLVEIQRSINEALSIEEVVKTVASQLLQIIPSRACVVTLRDEDGYVLHIVRGKTNRTSTDEDHQIRHVSLGSGPNAITIKRGVPYVCNSQTQCARNPVVETVSQYRSVLAVPVFAEDEVFGCIELVNKRGVNEQGGPAHYSDTDLKFLTLLAGQVSPAIATSLFRARKEKADRLASIGQILSSVLHDLKTPFTIVSGYVQLMSREDDKALRTEYSDSIRKQFGHLNQMTKEILSFARGESTVLLHKVFLNRFMTEVEEQLQLEFKGRNVKLSIVVNYRGTAKFDEGKIKRVIFNLARNAIEAMPDGGQFTISVDTQDKYVVFRFTDSGSGIPEDIRGRLFESFVTHGKSDGTGLGLAIVKKIVDAHNGTVDFESELEKGTTFNIKLPIEQ